MEVNCEAIVAGDGALSFDKGFSSVRQICVVQSHIVAISTDGRLLVRKLVNDDELHELGDSQRYAAIVALDDIVICLSIDAKLFSVRISNDKVLLTEISYAISAVDESETETIVQLLSLHRSAQKETMKLLVKTSKHQFFELELGESVTKCDLVNYLDSTVTHVEANQNCVIFARSRHVSVTQCNDCSVCHTSFSELESAKTSSATPTQRTSGRARDESVCSNDSITKAWPQLMRDFNPLSASQSFSELDPRNGLFSKDLYRIDEIIEYSGKISDDSESKTRILRHVHCREDSPRIIKLCIASARDLPVDEQLPSVAAFALQSDGTLFATVAAFDKFKLANAYELVTEERSNLTVSTNDYNCFYRLLPLIDATTSLVHGLFLFSLHSYDALILVETGANRVCNVRLLVTDDAADRKRVNTLQQALNSDWYSRARGVPFDCALIDYPPVTLRHNPFSLFTLVILSGSMETDVVEMSPEFRSVLHLKTLALREQHAACVLRTLKKLVFDALSPDPAARQRTSSNNTGGSTGEFLRKIGEHRASLMRTLLVRYEALLKAVESAAEMAQLVATAFNDAQQTRVDSQSQSHANNRILMELASSVNQAHRATVLYFRAICDLLVLPLEQHIKPDRLVEQVGKSCSELCVTSAQDFVGKVCQNGDFAKLDADWKTLLGLLLVPVVPLTKSRVERLCDAVKSHPQLSRDAEWMCAVAELRAFLDALHDTCAVELSEALRTRQFYVEELAVDCNEAVRLELFVPGRRCIHHLRCSNSYSSLVLEQLTIEIDAQLISMPDQPTNVTQAVEKKITRVVIFNDVLCTVSKGNTVRCWSHEHVWLNETWPISETSMEMTVSLRTPEERLLVKCSNSVSKKSFCRDFLHALGVATRTGNSNQIFLSPKSETDEAAKLALRTVRKPYTFHSLGVLHDATYVGCWLEAKMHNLGELKFRNNTSYQGQFKENRISGQGQLQVKYSDESKAGQSEPVELKGVWISGRMEGFGRVRYRNGDVYEGSLSATKRNGHGLMCYYNGAGALQSEYVGWFVDDRKHGYGVLNDHFSEAKYIGEWKLGVRDGFGQLILPDFSYIQGTFVQNRLCGESLLVLPTLTYFYGSCADLHEVNGRGTLCTVGGQKIVGTFAGDFFSKYRGDNELNANCVGSSALSDPLTGSHSAPFRVVSANFVEMHVSHDQVRRSESMSAEDVTCKLLKRAYLNIFSKHDFVCQLAQETDYGNMKKIIERCVMRVERLVRRCLDTLSCSTMFADPNIIPSLARFCFTNVRSANLDSERAAAAERAASASTSASNPTSPDNDSSQTKKAQERDTAQAGQKFQIHSNSLSASLNEVSNYGDFRRYDSIDASSREFADDEFADFDQRDILETADLASLGRLSQAIFERRTSTGSRPQTGMNYLPSYSGFAWHSIESSMEIALYTVRLQIEALESDKGDQKKHQRSSSVYTSLRDTLELLHFRPDSANVRNLDDFTVEDLSETRQYLKVAFSTDFHPLGRLCADMLYLFRATYTGVGVHYLLQRYATVELQSYLEWLYLICRVLFPALPHDMHTPFVLRSRSGGPSVTTTFAAVLDELIMNRFYTTLFLQYIAYNSTGFGSSSKDAYLRCTFPKGTVMPNRYDGPPNNDLAYYKNVFQLNCRLQSDFSLNMYLDVQPDLWLDQLESNRDLLRRSLQYPARESASASADNGFCAAAIRKFRSLTNTCTAREKLTVIVETVELLTQFCSTRTGKTWPTETSQLLDVLQFVLIRAQTPHLNAELQFIQDFSTHPTSEQMQFSVITRDSLDYVSHLIGIHENVCGYDPHMMSFLLTTLAAAYQVLRDGSD